MGFQEYKFPTIQDYIKQKPYIRPKRKRTKSSNLRIKYLSIKDLLSKTPEELVDYDIRPLYKKEFVLVVSFFSMSYPKKFPAFLRKITKVHIIDLEKLSLRKYFKSFKQHVRHTRKTIRLLENGKPCDKKCKWCPLGECIGGGGKNKLEKLKSWLSKPAV